METLKINGGTDWHFVNGAWTDGEGGGLVVPDALRRIDGPNLQGHHYAFNKKLRFKDLHARFEFRLTGHSDTGLIFRAADESNFLLLHFPNCGQAYRAQHFWAALSRMDGSGFQRIIKMEMIRRVPSTKGLWLAADAIVKGNAISVRIGEFGVFKVEDDALSGAGCVGVYSVGAADIRNVTVEGTPADAAWNDAVRQPTDWFHPCSDPEFKGWQMPQDLVRLKSGELLLNFTVQAQAWQGKSVPFLMRSKDHGRTWSKPELLKALESDDNWQPPRLHITPGGRLIGIIRQNEQVLAVESADGAKTWSAPVDLKIGPYPPNMPKLHMGPQGFINLKDGSMVMLLYGGNELKNPAYTVFTWGSLHCQAFACRSTDDGRTWSAPVNVDNPGCDDKGKIYDGNLDLTEVCGAQTGDGRIVALIRPIYSPWMWETWSADGGKTWGPCLRGPFPGYATPNMLRTASGKLLVAHRLPGLTVHVSPDDGRTWDEGTTIDGALWAMGAMIEVEPDIVFYVYYDSFESLMRGRIFKVTQKGLEPVRK